MAACLCLPRRGAPRGPPEYLLTNVAAKATQPRKLELIETNPVGHDDLVVQAWLPQRTRPPTTKPPTTAAVRMIHSSTFSTKNSLRSDLFTLLDVADAP